MIVISSPYLFILLSDHHKVFLIHVPGIRKASSDLAAGVAGIKLELESPRLVSLVRAAATESSVLVVVKSGAVERAVSTERLVVLVQEVRVEHLARNVAVLAGLDGGVAVEGVLLNGVVGAHLRVEGSGDELAAHVVLGGGDGLGTAVLAGLQGGLLGARAAGRGSRAASRGSRRAGGLRGGDNRGRDGGGRGRSIRDRARRSSDIGLVVGIGTSDDGLELLAVVALVGGKIGRESRAPESALVVSDGRGVGAVSLPGSVGGVVVVGRGKAGVALDIDVERSAEVSVITLGSALLGVVRGQGVETDVGVSRDGSVKVLEDLSVLGLVRAGDNSRGSRCHGVERSVGVESVDSVGLDLRTVTT